jgi:4-amino-4-deoxy-L-arabinose transferase-like glycosyltransferase
MQSGKDKVMFSVQGISGSTRFPDTYAVGAIGIYCAVYLLLRLLVSPTMEMSEAEQFLDASAFSLGYSQQAPLYSWIVKAASALFGMNFVTIIAVKYFLLFLFYLVFFLLAREFWDGGKALVITGSLLLFPVYSYETHRDLTHTILLSLMAVATCYLYIRMVRQKKTAHYVLAGILIGLGILSKYNFVFFPAALFVASLFSEEGRRVIFDKRIVLVFLCSALVLLPHLLWLAQMHFPSVHYAFIRAKAGGMASQPMSRTASIVFSSFAEVLLFLLVLGIIFRGHFSRSENSGERLLRLFRPLALGAMVIPLLVMVLLGTGNFTGRWLAPGLFTLPFAIFSFVDMGRATRQVKLLAAICLLIAVSVVIARAVVGFLPDVTGKVERIHIPFDALSVELAQKLTDRGIAPGQVAVITGYGENFMAANVMARMPGARLIRINKSLNERSVLTDIGRTGGIVLYDESKGIPEDVEKFLEADPLKLDEVAVAAPFMHSSGSASYVLKAVIIPKSAKGS